MIGSGSEAKCADNTMDEIQRAEQIAIYGAGVIAQHTYLLIKNLFHKKFLGFWVSEWNPSDVKQAMTREMYHQPIYGLRKTPIPTGTLTIICVSQKYKEEIESTLSRESYPIHFIYLSTELQNQLFISYYQKYFCSLGIDTSKEILCRSSSRGVEITIKNPFRAPLRDQNSCFTELGTIILPFCMEELSMCSETPYEYGPVSLSAFQKGVVFDLGANQGYFSVIAASMGHTVYAFEPSHRLIENLQYYERKYAPFLHVEEAAAFNQDGMAELFVDKNSDASNSLIMQTNADHTQCVRTVTIDTYRKEHNLERVSLIKADIEGAERDMLMGAKETLRTCAPFLSICTYHLPDDPEVIREYILSCNPAYKIIQKEKKLYAYVSR